MQEPKTGGRAERVRKPKGLQALMGAAIAIVGALATVHPTSAVLVALSDPPEMVRRVK